MDTPPLETKYTRFSAVYYLGDQDDHQLLVDNEEAGVCDTGTTIPDPSLQCSKIYYKCLPDQDTNLQSWQKQTCPKNETDGKQQKFSRRSHQCSTDCELIKYLISKGDSPHYTPSLKSKD